MADDTLAILTREEAYEAINDPKSAQALINPDRDPEVVGIWVPAVSRRIDELCGPVVVRTVTDERHDGGGHSVALYRSPALSVTTVTEYQHGASYVLTREQDDDLPDYGYVLETLGTTTFVTRRQAGFDLCFYPGRQNVKVTYEAGRYADTDEVDPKFKMAAAAILRRLWAREAGSWARGGDPFAAAGEGTLGFFKAVDPMVKEFLADELRAPAVA